MKLIEKIWVVIILGLMFNGHYSLEKRITTLEKKLSIVSAKNNELSTQQDIFEYNIGYNIGVMSTNINKIVDILDIEQDTIKLILKKQTLPSVNPYLLERDFIWTNSGIIITNLYNYKN